MVRMAEWMSFDLEPRNELAPLSGRLNGWMSYGSDPQFACTGSDFPLRPGWYRMELDLELHAGPMMAAFLYPDFGPDARPDVAGLYLPFIRPESRHHSGIVRFAQAVHGLRFDPAICPCDFSVRGLRLYPVGRLPALARLLRSVMGRHPRWRTRARVVAAAGLRLFKGGPRALGRWLYGLYSQCPMAVSGPYDVWTQLYDSPSTARASEAPKQIAQLRDLPTFSVLVPTYNTTEKWLRSCIDSVRAQLYPHWELCIADDASPQPHIGRILREYAEMDDRIRFVVRESNGHISAASNSALDLARGDFVALLDHDDELPPHALLEVAKALNRHPEWKVIYSDEDKIDDGGVRYDPYMKPDWNYDLFLSHNCISHLGVYRRDLLVEVGGFRQGYEGSQDWDLALRCIERLEPGQVGHIPKVLYHWRAIPGSTALAPQEKDYAHEAGLRAVNEHLARIGSQGRAEEIPGKRGNFRVRYKLPGPVPKISLIIPTRDRVDLLRRCVESILKLTTYQDYEIVIVDNQSEEDETLRYLRDVQRDSRVTVLSYDKPFNYSALNNYAAAHTTGDIVGLVNNDIELISPDWLEEMAGHAMRKEIGAVGAMLYYPNDTIQHAGVILGVHGVAAHAYCGEPRGAHGHMGRATLVQGMSAVTAACLLVRREVYEEVGGLDESLRVAFNDIDFCLRVRAAGYRNLWTPFAELYHHESATRGYEDSPEKKQRFLSEVDFMMNRWGAELAADPAYSPNFTLSGKPFELAFAPRYLD